MKDKRIDVMCEELRRYWNKHPELRFIQVIELIANGYLEKSKIEIDPFYVADEYFLSYLVELNNEK